MSALDKPPFGALPDLSAGECCAQAQMASYARLEAARRAHEQGVSRVRFTHRLRQWLRAFGVRGTR